MAFKTMRLILLAPFAVTLMLLQGCGVLGYDNREQLAKSTLYDQKGVLDEKAFASALLGKFDQQNSPPASLVKFVESLGGKCTINVKDAMSCSIPQSGTFCLENSISLSVIINSGAISKIFAKSQFLGC
jgi:hypothetical protein